MRVGAILVTDTNRLVASGYNGSHSGESETCSKVPGSCGHALHAERNALTSYIGHANYETAGNLKFYVTHLPCIRCAELIVSYNILNPDGVWISEVFYGKEYRDKSSKQLLKKAGIKLRKVSL